MKKLLLLLITVISNFTFAQIKDGSGDSAVDANSNPLTGNISIQDGLYVNNGVTANDFFMFDDRNVGMKYRDGGFNYDYGLFVGDIGDEDVSTYITGWGSTLNASSLIGLLDAEILFKTTAGNVMRIVDEKVGIGTDYPNSLLNVGAAGEPSSLSVSGSFNGGHVVNFRDNLGENMFQINGQVDDGSMEILIGDMDEINDGNYLKVEHDKSYFMNGNLGIGTSTPDEALAVNGSIHAKEVRVDLIGWPDFVFESNYNLPSLIEVEQHINDNGHLQNIPSAAEVEENGVLLGEMNKLLLQKIEELTLYTIQQQKMIIELQKKVDEIYAKN